MKLTNPTNDTKNEENYSPMESIRERLKAAESERFRNLGASSISQAAKDYLKAAESEMATKLGASSIHQAAKNYLKAAESGRIRNLGVSPIHQAAKDYLKAAESEMATKLGASSIHQAAKDYLKIAESERIRNIDTSSMHQIAQDLKTKELEQFTQTRADIKKLLLSGFCSFNLNPDTSLASLLNNINYAASSSEALNKDWQNVGNDLWKSWAAIKDEHE